MNTSEHQISYSELAGLLKNEFEGYYLALVGSYAEGDSDENSDVDLVLFLRDQADQSQLKKLEQTIGLTKASRINAHDGTYSGWAFYGQKSGYKIDLNIVYLPQFRSMLDELLINGRPNNQTQRLVNSVLKHRRICSDFDIQDLQQRCREFPDLLQKNIIISCLNNMKPPRQFYRDLSRGDHLNFVCDLNMFFMRVSVLVYALNKIHSSRIKKAFKEPLKIMPQELAAQMNKALLTPSVESVKICESIYDDLVQLIREHTEIEDLDRYLNKNWTD